MVTTKQLLYLNSLGLNLTDILVYLIIASTKGPCTLSDILCCQNLEIKERQLRNIITKLENLNLLSRFRNQYNQHFVLPYVFSKKIKRLFKVKSGNSLPIKTGKKHVVNLIDNLRPATLYLNNYIYNNYIKIRKFNVISRKYNYINNINEEEITYNTEKRNLVVTKNNYNKIKNIKEQFKKDFPTKNAFLAQDLPKEFNYSLLKEKIKNSTFLTEKDNLGLNWFVKNYQKVINDFYSNVEKKNFSNYNTNNTDFSQRTYTKEFCDSLFDVL